MKTPFKVSVLTNILLMVIVCWFFARHSMPGGDLIQKTAAINTVPAPNVAQPPSKQIVQYESFRWSQLESTNYRTYICNLRRVGCPEQTIREIVVADVDDLYKSRRQELERRQRIGDPLDARKSELDASLRQLRDEQGAVVQALLGPNNPSAEIAAEAPTPNLTTPTQTPQQRLREAEERRDLERPVTMPLVLQPVNLAALDVSPSQVEVINDLRQKFERQIGGSNQDPNDPAYLKRWQAAQRNADEWMAVLLGRDFRLKYQLQAMNQSQTQQPPQ